MEFKHNIKKLPLVTDIRLLYINIWNMFFRKQRFAVFHIGRVGSTVIGDMMNQHPKVFWPGEIFEKLMRSGTNKHNQFVNDTISKSQSIHVSPIYAFETKFMPEQHLWEECIDMDLESYISLLKKSGFNKYIVIKRENYLRQLVSVLVGRKKRKWHSTNEENKVTTVKIEVNNYQSGFNLRMPLVEYFDRIEKQYSLLENLTKADKVLNLSYERDIEKKPFKAYSRICEFFNIEADNPEISFQKTNPFSLKDMIENYDEVKEALIDTKYKWMLEV